MGRSERQGPTEAQLGPATGLIPSTAGDPSSVSCYKTHYVFVDANIFYSETSLDWLFFLCEGKAGLLQIHSEEELIPESLIDMCSTTGDRVQDVSNVWTLRCTYSRATNESRNLPDLTMIVTIARNATRESPSDSTPLHHQRRFFIRLTMAVTIRPRTNQAMVAGIPMRNPRSLNPCLSVGK